MTNENRFYVYGFSTALELWADPEYRAKNSEAQKRHQQRKREMNQGVEN